MFRFESGLFKFMMVKSSVIDVISVTSCIDVVSDSYTSRFCEFGSLCAMLYCRGLGFGWIWV